MCTHFATVFAVIAFAPPSLPHTGLGKEYALLLASRGAKVVGKGVGGALQEGCMSGWGTYI